MRDKLMEAMEAKNNDIKSFVWKLARKADGTQEEIHLVDATPEQLNQFYKHCLSMLHSTDKLNPGRYVLLDIISEQRKKCNVELFLRKLESGEICADGKPYPRHLYIQDLRGYMNSHKGDFPSNELKNISIAACTGGLPREFERISIDDVLDGGLDQLGLTIIFLYSNSTIYLDRKYNIIAPYIREDVRKSGNIGESPTNEDNTEINSEITKGSESS